MFYFYAYWILIVFSILFITSMLEQKLRGISYKKKWPNIETSLFNFREDGEIVFNYKKGNFSFILSYLLILLGFVLLKILPSNMNLIAVAGFFSVPFIFRAISIAMCLRKQIFRDEYFWINNVFKSKKGISYFVSTVIAIINLVLSFLALKYVYFVFIERYESANNSVGTFIVMILTSIIFYGILEFLDKNLIKKIKK